MILNSNTKQGESQSIGIEESINMTIDTSDQAALMMILSENLYKDPIGSLVREAASNALDATKAANDNKPIIVKLAPDRQHNWVFSVQDFGVGISPDDVKNVLSKYAASTKRGSNDYLGYYGLGFKAPLAYTDSFYFITRWGGIEYTYMMYKGEEGTKIDLVNETILLPEEMMMTGTTVSIQVHNQNDRFEFVRKIKEQLAYFEGVYFEVAGISNNFRIIKHEDWKFSELNPGAEMHLCLGDVHYDIDWKKLKMDPIEVPIALNFSLRDGLMPIPSREDIKYTPEAIELIKIKLAATADFFVTKYNETVTEVADFEEIYNKFGIYTVDIDNKIFDISNISKYSYITPHIPTLKGVSLISLKEVAEKSNKLLENYHIRGEIHNSIYKSKYKDGYNNIFPIRNNNKSYLIVDGETPKGVKLDYIKYLYPYVKFLYKRVSRKLGHTDYIGWIGEGETILTYRQLLKLGKYPKSEWRQRIKEFQLIENSILDKINKVSDFEPTQSWLEERKANRKKGDRRSVGNEEITLKKARKAERGIKNKMAFDLVGPYKIKEVGKEFKALIVYGTTEEKGLLDKYGPMSFTAGKKGGSRAKFFIINRYDIKKIQDLPNFISIGEFMKGENKPFKAFATAILIEKLIVKYNKQFEHIKFIKTLSKSLAEKMEELKKYASNNYPEAYYGSKSFFNEVARVAVENNLLDTTIIDVYNEVEVTLKNYDFISFLDIYAYNTIEKEDEIKQLAIEVLKGRKEKLDWENYSSPSIISSIEGEPNDDDDEEEEEFGDETSEIAPIASELEIDEADIQDINEEIALLEQV